MIKVLSWNILSSNWVNPEELHIDYPNVDKSHLTDKERYPKIIKFIKQTNADVITLQEANSNTRKILANIFKGKYKVLPLAAHKGNHWNQKTATGLNGKPLANGNLIMLRKFMFSKISQTVIQLHKNGNVAPVVSCVHKETGRPIIISTIHFDDMYKDLRHQQASSIIKRLNKYRDKAFIICSGDFNIDIKDKLHRFYEENGYKRTVKDRTSTFLCEDIMIDHIYIHGGRVHVSKVYNKVNNDSCMVSTLSKYGSDHYPVLSEIKIT